MTNTSPIGIFDSGVGGLTIYSSLKAQLPNEQFVYIADISHAPYGNKPAEDIHDRATKISRFLVDRYNCKLIVIACNTATAISVADLRNSLETPFVAIEPAIKPAIENANDGVIGVLATPQTLSSDKFNALISRYADKSKIITIPCPKLAAVIESEFPIEDNISLLLDEYLAPLIAEKANTVVLGCTHYPLVKHMIERKMGEHVTIIEPSLAVSKRVFTVLQERQIAAPITTNPVSIFLATKHDNQLSDKFSRIAHQTINVTPILI